MFVVWQHTCENCEVPPMFVVWQHTGEVVEQQEFHKITYHRNLQFEKMVVQELDEQKFLLVE